MNVDAYVDWLYYTKGMRYGSQDLYDEWLKAIGERQPKPLEVVETKPGRCECGSDAVGSRMHSQWCPAYEK